MNAQSRPRYIEPTRGTAMFNAAVGQLTKMGISVYGSRVLAVRGRKSGEGRTTPGNPPTLDGGRDPVSPPGDTPAGRTPPGGRGGAARDGREVHGDRAAGGGRAGRAAALPQEVEVRGGHVLPGRRPGRPRGQAAGHRPGSPGLPDPVRSTLKITITAPAHDTRLPGP